MSLLLHCKTWPRYVRLRHVDLYVDVVGHGEPLVLMHGGPSADLWTMGAFRRLADEHTLIFYDHRCNGRSTGPTVSSMTWENLTADADALREHLGFEEWTVLGHSFGGHVALEYALRYPDRVSGLVLLDTGADAHWARENAPRLLAQRGYGAAKAELVRRWFTGEFERPEYLPIFLRISSAYMPHHGWRALLRELATGGWRSRMRPAPLQFAGRTLLPGWSVTDRLGDITAPTLVIAGREDFVFPPDCQQELVAGLRHAELLLVDEAGHSPQDEFPNQVVPAVRHFLTAGVRAHRTQA
ncbi:alpha/beta hydrolase [Terrabacter sp. NPDC080008]|uniref:alpha/beta fold hydrolase n=1 Tax=Terrabacter sp. NPDC080008 TaxID=3155176 RepID=UPI00344E7DE1